MTLIKGRSHARYRLDEVIHAPVRFSIVAALASVDEAEFALVRDTVEVSDSVLSKAASALETAGYVKVRKGYVGKRPRTWLSLTRAGRGAYGKHLLALRDIAGPNRSGSGLTWFGKPRRYIWRPAYGNGRDGAALNKVPVSPRVPGSGCPRGRAAKPSGRSDRCASAGRR